MTCNFRLIRTQIAKQEFICQALDEMGIQYETDTSGQLSLATPSSSAKANVVVRKEQSGSQWDMGWALDRESGTFVEILSDYDRQHSPAGGIARQVKQKSALFQVQEMAWTNGYAVNVVDEATDPQRVFIGGGR
jgi:hypothetical protein